jgi:hypothetical protein
LYPDLPGTGIPYTLGSRSPSSVTPAATSDGQPAADPAGNPYATGSAAAGANGQRHRNTATALIFHLHGAPNHRVQTLTLHARS